MAVATKPKSQQLRALSPIGQPGQVDMKAKAIYGYEVARVGVFNETPARGSFNMENLHTIVKLMNAAPGGVKSHLDHASVTDSGLTWYLGRAKNARIAGTSVKADLFLDESSFHSPHGDIGNYVLTRAKSDPSSLSSSLVLGEIEIDHNDRSLAPVWVPQSVLASDVVGEGAAAGSLLRPASQADQRRAKLKAMETRVAGLPDGVKTRLAQFESLNDPVLYSGGNVYTVLAHWPYRFRYEHAERSWERLESNAFGNLQWDVVPIWVDHNERLLLGDMNGPYRNATITSDEHGVNLKLMLDDINPLHAETIDRIISGKYSGLSFGMQVTEQYDVGGLHCIRRASMNECSISSGPGNTMSALLFVERAPPMWVLNALMTTPTNEHDAIHLRVIRKLMKWREQLAA